MYCCGMRVSHETSRTLKRKKVEGNTAALVPAVVKKQDTKENKKAQLVVIIHDVNPIEPVVLLPALSRKVDVPYRVIKGRAGLDLLVQWKTCTTVPSRRWAWKTEALEKLVEAIRTNSNDRDDEVKEERIVELEAENAILHLKLAEAEYMVFYDHYITRPQVQFTYWEWPQDPSLRHATHPQPPMGHPTSPCTSSHGPAHLPCSPFYNLSQPTCPPTCPAPPSYSQTHCPVPPSYGQSREMVRHSRREAEWERRRRREWAAATQLVRSIQALKWDLSELRASFLALLKDVQGTVQDRASEVVAAVLGTQLCSEALQACQSRAASLEASLQDVSAWYHTERQKRRALHNTLVELKGNMRVHCRIRPLLPSDAESHARRRCLQRTPHLLGATAVGLTSRFLVPCSSVLDLNGGARHPNFRPLAEYSLCSSEMAVRAADDVSASPTNKRSPHSGHSASSTLVLTSLSEEDMGPCSRPAATGLAQDTLYGLVPAARWSPGCIPCSVNEGCVDTGPLSPSLTRVSAVWTCSVPVKWAPETVVVTCGPPGHPPVHRTYTFERVYSPAEGQDAVFEDVRPLLISVLDGYNVCIMAYGQTGSGKSYTMLGPRAEEHTAMPSEAHRDSGIVPRAAQELFRLISESPSLRPEVEVSIVEVYNNEVFDLLAKEDSSVVSGAKDRKRELALPTHELVRSAEELVKLVGEGLQLRVSHPTLVHASSSRSHLIVTVTLPSAASSEGHPSDHTMGSVPSCPSPRPAVREKRRASCLALPVGLGPRGASVHLGQVQAQLQFVDLAGSESADVSGVTGLGLRESSCINRSLAALGDVLGALGEHRGHIPYRNSKLTHLLQDTIGGDAKLLVVLCVSPCNRHLSTTLQSLAFGVRAQQVQGGRVRRRGWPAQGSPGEDHVRVGGAAVISSRLGGK
ncbi:PREDICTED: uncharacterized protein LOC102868726 [Elephantulus edwardii]|uniref:uncharacterized protein LOC102868726 n=1 Tax=Elephantulus edwardii TaxID=28737 RepID=UPI0003F06863|nr:PREDICTED: uncharacterized protein LOC102868726 [Elephantulus edwardii]